MYLDSLYDNDRHQFCKDRTMYPNVIQVVNNRHVITSDVDKNLYIALCQ